AGVAVRLLARLRGVPRLLRGELWIVARETDGSREARGVALPQRGATPVRGDRVVDVRPLRPGVDHGATHREPAVQLARTHDPERPVVERDQDRDRTDEHARGDG